MKKIVLIIITLLLYCDQISADRPLITIDCFPVQTEKFLIESGFMMINSHAYHINAVWITSLTYGIMDNIDCGIDIPFWTLTPNGDINTSGLGDLTLKTKWNVIPIFNAFGSVSIGLSAKLANGTASKSLGTGTTDYTILGIYTHNLLESRLHINYGYTRVEKSAGQSLKNRFNYGVAYEFIGIEQWKLLAEVFGNTPSNPEQTTYPVETRFAAAYELRPNMVADMAISVGLSDASPQNRYIAGLSFKF